MKKLVVVLIISWAAENKPMDKEDKEIAIEMSEYITLVEEKKADWQLPSFVANGGRLERNLQKAAKKRDLIDLQKNLFELYLNERVWDRNKMEQATCLSRAAVLGCIAISLQFGVHVFIEWLVS